MRTTVFVIGLAGVVGLLGCVTTPEIEEQEGAAAGSSLRGAAAQSQGGLLEYRHTPDRSRMVTGPHTASRREDGQDKIVGDWGTLAIDLANGHSQGVPNADAPMLEGPPFGSTLEEHNEHVKQMFLAAGVPEDEIGSVQGSVGSGYRGRAGEAPRPFGDPWYVSTLTRTTGGIPVAESFAWARINARDEVASEAVYWPAIPQKVVDQAKALQAKLDDPRERAAFIGRLPIPDRREAESGRVAIRHSSAVVDGPFEAYAVFDVTRRTDNGASYTQHFDANGVEVRLPQDRRAPPSTPRPSMGK